MKELDRDQFLKASIESIVPTGLSPADVHAAKVIGRQYSDIIARAKETSVKITQIIVDPENVIAFPIFSNDTLESLLKRYRELYRAETIAMLEYVKQKIQENPTGFGKNLKWNVSVPSRFVSIMKALDKNWWASAKNLNHFKQLCPKLCSKNKNSQITIH